MKKTILTLITGTLILVSCSTTANKEENLTDTVSISVQTANDTIKHIDTATTNPVKEKTDEQKADESLDRIMKKRKNVQ